MNTSSRLSALAVVALCGLCASAFAQDSTGLVSVTNPGVTNDPVGDALPTHDVNQIRRTFVVDGIPFQSNYGNSWGLWPVMKSSRNQPGLFFNGAFSAQALSQDQLGNVDLSSVTFAEWDGPTKGIHPTDNAAPDGNVAGPTNALQLATIFSEFGGFDGNIVGGFINWDADAPGRKYVSRVLAANSTSANQGASSASFGVGAVDAHGNAIFRADSFTPTGAPTVSVVNDDGMWRVDLAQRANGQLFTDSLVSDGTSNNATNAAWLDAIRYGQNIGFGNTITPAGMIPESVQGARSVYVGSSFVPGYVHENAVNTTTAVDGNGAGFLTGPSDDSRGGIAVLPSGFFGNNTVATGAVLGKPQPVGTNPNDNTFSIIVFGINADGSIDPATVNEYRAPWAIDGTLAGNVAPNSPSTDPITGYDVVAGEFDGYRSQLNFQGPTGPAALGLDRDGNLLVAGIVYNQLAEGGDPANSIVVARVQTTGAVAWTTVAYNDYPGVNGKVFNDGGPAGPVYARLVANEDIVNFNLRGLATGDSNGPSFSAPAFDSRGNVYFLAAIQIKRGVNQQGADDFDELFPPTNAIDPVTQPDDRDLFEYGLIRAELSDTVFGYNLDLMLRTGQVFTGADSGVDFMLDRMSMADGNSGSSASMGQGSVTKAPFNGVALGSAAPSNAPEALGGLIFRAGLVYDSDGLDTIDTPTEVGLAPDTTLVGLSLDVGGEGQFENPTADVGPTNVLIFPDALDQAYNTLMFVSFLPEAPTGGACCVFSCEGIGQPSVCTDVPGQAECEALGGKYLGDGTDCAGSFCEVGVDVCIGDLDGDGSVLLGDFGIFSGNFGQVVPLGTGGDLDCDGQVLLADFGIFSNNFGCVPTP